MDHFVITVARETGSGGHDITRKLSEKLNIPYYDRDLLRKASEVSGIHERLFGAADERIGWKEMLSAAEKVYTGEILPPDSNDFISTRNLFSFQAKIIKELAATEDCIILGRCANYLLMDQPNVRLLRLFVHAPLEARLARVASYSLAWRAARWQSMSAPRTSAAPPITATIPARNGGTPQGTTCRWTPSSWVRTAAWRLFRSSCRCLPEFGQEKTGGECLQLPRGLMRYGRIFIRQNRVCLCGSMVPKFMKQMIRSLCERQ